MKRILGLVLCVIGCAGCWSEMRQDVYDTYNRYVTSLDQECHGPTTPECAMKYRRLEDWKNDQLDEINRRRESVRAAGYFQSMHFAWTYCVGIQLMFFSEIQSNANCSSTQCDLQS